MLWTPAPKSPRDAPIFGAELVEGHAFAGCQAHGAPGGGVRLAEGHTALYQVIGQVGGEHGWRRWRRACAPA